MVSTRKERQSNRRFLSQLDDCEQDVIIGNATSEGQAKVIVNESTNDRDFIVDTFSNNLTTNENTVNVRTLERGFKERIDRETSKIVVTVENRIQNAFFIAIDSIVVPKIELAIRSINVTSGRDATSVTANSEPGEHLGNNAPFENESGNNIVLHVSNVNDETRINIPDEVSELPVLEACSDRYTHSSLGDRTNHPNKPNP